MPPPSSSLVHPEETNRPIDSCYSYGDYRRHLAQADYDSAERVYGQIYPVSESSHLWNLQHCRDSAWFMRNLESGEVRVAAKSCHLRWCPLCAEARRNFISFEVQGWCEKLKYPKFLTLTLKHTDEALKVQIDNLYRHFRSLRKRSHFKKLVTGGIWFFQVKRSKTDGCWHPHLHCLIGGLYIPHGWLTRAWEQITYGSTVVDIRPINDPRKASNDAARYASAPCSLSSLSLADGIELVKCMHGRRICGTWGTGRKVSLRPALVGDSGKWESIGNWDTVMSLRKTDHTAEAIFRSWQDNTPLPDGLDLTYKEMAMNNPRYIDIDDYDLDTIYPSERGPP